MKAYDAITVNNNGQPFPNTEAVNSSGPLVLDGTEFLKDVVNDVWLEKQALIDFYYPGGPDGLGDFAGVDAGGLPLSQPLAAQYMNFGTPGVIVNWPSDIDPAILGAGLGIDIRLLLLHGQGIDRTLDEYKMLDSIVYAGDPDNATADAYYHADDALGTIRNTAGQYLILPDARGYAWRALDPSGAIDPDGASRIVGSSQEDAFQNITGYFDVRRGDDNSFVIGHSLGVHGVFTRTNTTNNNSMDITATTRVGTRIDFDASNSPGAKTNNVETRIKNIATNYAIHF